MLPWLLDLGLGVFDLGLAAAAVALVVEGLPGGLTGRDAPETPPAQPDGGADASEDDDDA